MKPTPGPWEYFPKLSGSENHRGFRIGVDKGWFIADAMPIDMDGKEGEANARLIAAAPDLLEALQLLLDIERGGDQGGSFRERLYAAFRKAEKAVSKATGEQQ